MLHDPESRCHIPKLMVVLSNPLYPALDLVMFSFHFIYICIIILISNSQYIPVSFNMILHIACMKYAMKLIVFVVHKRP